MTTTTPESSRAGAASSPYVPVAAHELRRQMSMPAALAPTVASCGSGGGRGRGWPRTLRGDDGGGDGELRGRSPRPAAGGVVVVGAVVRALWAWVTRRKAVMSRTGSSLKEKQQQQYGHEEYAQNFDEAGGAAGEPENLSRSFSARYAARQAPWDDDGARRRG